MSLEQRGHAEFDFFDRKVRQGRHDKAFRKSAGTEAKIYRKAKAARQIAPYDEGLRKAG